MLARCASHHHRAFRAGYRGPACWTSGSVCARTRPPECGRFHTPAQFYTTFETSMGRTCIKTKGRKSRILASQIRELRERMRLNQGQFARLLGVSQQTVSDWERSERLRQIEIAMRLVTLLGAH